LTNKKNKTKNSNSQTPTIRNKRGLYNYSVISNFEAGISLKGGEVKSIRNSQITIHESYAKIEHGEVWLHNLHITKPLSDSTDWETLRKRKLLLHKKEIRKILQELNTNPAFTLIPVKMYFSRGKIKIEIALASGKKKFDKRETIKKREISRSMQNQLKKSMNKFN
jgi:SsrA-binding protein